MMNYKRIFKNRKLRIKILHLLSFIPNRPMIKLQYRIKTGRKLNLKNPLRFTEKLQWYKLYYHNDLMVKCVDKYDVRDYVKSKGLGNILNHCYGVFNNFERIKFNDLPNSFVLKDTLGGGGNSVILIKNKFNINMPRLQKEINNWLKVNTRYVDDGREWPYSQGNEHRIIIENYIVPNNDENELIEYKFFCFNGKVEFLYVLADRILGKNVALGIFNKNFEQLDIFRKDERKLLRKIPKPGNFQRMIEIAEILSDDFLHARIDLFNVDNKIIFGEITFFDGSGYMTYEPDEFDFILGDCFKLDKNYL